MKCSDCQTEKAIDEFVWKNKALGTRTGICKGCQRIRSKRNYENNRSYYLNKNSENRKAITTKLVKLKIEKGCVDCQEKHPACLDFDHVTGNKVADISKLIDHGWLAVEQELQKCVVRCANCHRKRTAIMLNWYSSLQV